MPHPLQRPTMISRFTLLFAILIGHSATAAASAILERLVAGNDALIAAARALPPDDRGAAFSDREAATRLLVYACGLVAPGSRYHHDAGHLAAMIAVADRLAEVQHPSGLFDSGNLESPPDSGFILEALAKTLQLLRQDAQPGAEPLRERLRALVRRTAPAVAAGGVHTPNHRWGVCAALALAHHLEPDPRYPARIAEWLAEGVDQDSDGHYSERSPAYSAKVVNPAFLLLAERQGRTDLLEHVRRNLALTWWLTEPNGDVVTVASRRQDQRPGTRVSIAEYYLPARWLARRQGDARMAALVEWIERDFLEVLVSGPLDPNWPLPWLLADPDLTGPLPTPQPWPQDFTVELKGSGLVRLRRGDRTVTLYGGSDHPSGLGTGSGLATNPTFFTLRRGAARVSARLTPSFFGTGFFYSDGVRREGDQWRLHQRLAVPYHQPLPAEHRRTDGDYALSADGRFFSKMDFARRPKEYRTLEAEVSLTERDGGVTLDVVVTGHAGVPVTLELSVPNEGDLTGVTPLAELPAVRRGSWMRRGGGGAPRGATDTSDAFVLREGRARLALGTDVIEFGPGHFTQPPGRMEGEDYTWVGGSLRAEGRRIYVTAVTPFRHTLTLR